jgi:4-hydroxy-2-oxoheptanedioate aldolase
LKSGVPQIGLSIGYPSPGVIERIGGDWDWIWIDSQHGEMGYEQVLHLVRACDLVDRPALVRVSDHSSGGIGKALDMGPAGVIVPCVDTVAQAEAVVRAAKFPPLGNRSYGGRRAIDRGTRQYSDDANEQLLCVVQIESPEAVENADAIAAIPGVDALFLGPDDIMLRRGFDALHPRNESTLGDDMQKVIDACRAHGKYAVMVGVAPSMFKTCVEMGYHLIVAGADVPFLANSSKSAATEARAMLTNRSAGPVRSVLPPESAASPY